MKYILSQLIIPFILVLIVYSVSAQSYQNPVNIPPFLSANFGELRNNHFHSGIDYKTQSVENKPIIAIADGYVSRINISAGGYGLALYITHPATGHTSVYGHLNNFSKPIADYAKQKQYEQETFRIDISVPQGVLPVKRGEQIALSGNTGGSGGPHLHFEIRETDTEQPIDPLTFYSQTITDTQAPDFRGIAFYPIAGKGVVNNGTNPIRLNLKKSKAGALLPFTQTITAWGRIGIGVKAYDRMNGQNNVYGVKTVRLYRDGELIFSSRIDKFPFDKTRMLNSFVDFEDWRREKSFYMPSFVEPGNTLAFYNNVKNNGYIDITEERAYNFRYELEDTHGNKSSFAFTVQGKKQDIPPLPECANYMAWKFNNTVADYDFLLNIPAGNLYKDICFNHNRTVSDKFYSDIFTVNNTPVPLHGSALLWIKLKADTLDIRDKYGVVQVDNRGNGNWVGGAYKNGGVEFRLNELGNRYAIDMDTITPKISPLEPEKWVQQRKIRIRLTDDKSGINTFRGTINGNFVLFTHDVKSTIYTYSFDNERLERGNQELIFTATDGAGNVSEYRYGFEY